MPLTPEQAIARVPFLAKAQDLKITPLVGGITNLNYRIDADGKSYVLRITGADTELLGIHREVEYAANLEAGKLGVAPEVVYFIEPEGYLVTRFVDGVKVPPEEMVKPENIRRVAEKVRTFHRHAPPLAGEFNVFRRVEMLTATSRRNHCKFPANFDWIVQKMREVEDALRRDPYVPRPCHDDLLNLNFLDEHGDLRILDWEYAGMGDIFFDLGNFSHHHQLSDEQVNLLLQAYFGEVTPKAFARLKLMWPMSETHEAMWGTTQTGISKLDEDFQGYADLWFGRATEAMQDPRWNQWLEDVAG
jgi:thiamine kinase-like enzyme